MTYGLLYIPNFLSFSQEQELISIIDSNEWDFSLKRVTEHYGWKYDYTSRTVKDKDFLGPLPDWLANLENKIYNTGHFSCHFNQVIINQYLPGQGISRHVDKFIFGPEIVSISLISNTEMHFIKYSVVQDKILLEPKSLLALTGKARYDYMHEIPKVKNKRVSITFRNIEKC